MRLQGLVFFVVSILFAGAASAGCDATAWRFGMSPEEVTGVSQCGPYKTFSNGDLETYHGIFEGAEENYQFFFKDKKLVRIGVYLYEGGDPVAGGKRWLSLYHSLSRLYGKVNTPYNVTLEPDDSNSDAFTGRALKVVHGVGKIQMMPSIQPEGASIFSSFMGSKLNGKDMYAVILYFNKVNGQQN